jgi:hypothetical protein
MTTHWDVLINNTISQPCNSSVEYKPIMRA